MKGLSTANALTRHSSASLARCAVGASSRALRTTTTTTPAATLSTTPIASSSSSPLSHRWTTQSSFLQTRCFSQSPAQWKKKDKQAKEKKGGGHNSSGNNSSNSSASKGADEDDAGGNHPQAKADDPFDFADVESRWQKSEQHHEEKLKELKRALGLAGGGGAQGSVDVDAIGRTPVTLREGEEEEHHPHESSAAKKKGKQEKQEKQTPAKEQQEHTVVPLSQLALVIPRSGGRFVELRMHSAGSRKAIVSAVQADPQFHGQQPQPDPDDELVLLLRVGEVGGGGNGKDELAEKQRKIHDLTNGWRAQIRKATARRQKTHQTWKKDGSVRPDDLHRLDRDLLKGQEKRMGKIDAVEKETLRQLEQARRIGGREVYYTGKEKEKKVKTKERKESQDQRKKGRKVKTKEKERVKGKINHQSLKSPVKSPVKP